MAAAIAAVASLNSPLATYAANTAIATSAAGE